MRSIWKGAISFGLVTIPVKLYSATEERDVSFHQVHREDGGRIRYKRVCSIDGQEVSYSDISKGYELPSGETVVLTDDDFADLPLATSRTVEVLQFVPLEQVDPMYFARSYYIEPEKVGTKPYVLLREALERSGRVALVKVALRQREALATLRTRDGVIVLETMLWPDEIRTPDFTFLSEDISVRSQEVTMAESLIEALSGDFEPEQYTDAYREALQELIEAKIAGREVVEPTEKGREDTGTVVDLMAALRASVAAAKQDRGEISATVEPDAEDAPEKAAPRAAAKTPVQSGAKRGGKGAAKSTAKAAPKQPAGKSAPARKIAAKKTAATKAGAKKSAGGAAARKTSGSRATTQKASPSTERSSAAAKRASTRRSA